MDHEPIEEYKLKLKNLSLGPKQEFKRIKCPSCGSVIPASNLNINDKIAKCNSCNVVFPFHRNISDLLKNFKAKQEVIKPEGIEIFEYRDEVEFSIQSPFAAFDIIPLAIISLFTFVFTIAFFKEGLNWMVPATSWALLMFPIYYLFQRKHHKIFLTFDDKSLHIKWRPKKMIKDKSFPKDEIDQFYIKTAQGYNSIFMISNGPDGQKHTSLITGIMSLTKARYLEQEMERHLGINDREVPEETK